MEDKQKLTEIEAKEGDGTIAECSDYYVPYGVTSFSDLETYRAAQETAGEVRELFSDFQQIASNIMSSQTIENKADAIIALTTEFIGMLTPGGSDTEETEIASSEIAEAATLKSHAKNAIKALEGLLGEKTLPKKLMQQITEMKSALNRTWKDLEDEKNLEDVTSPDTEEEACKDKKKKMKEMSIEKALNIVKGYFL